MTTKKHWHGDTLNSQGTIVFQIRNDKELFVLKAVEKSTLCNYYDAVASEVILNRSEAEFLLASLQRYLKPKKECCDNQTKIYNHDKTKWSCFHCGTHN